MKRYIGLAKFRFDVHAEDEDEAYEKIEEILKDYDIIFIDLEEDDYPNEDQDRERKVLC